MRFTVWMILLFLMLLYSKSIVGGLAPHEWVLGVIIFCISTVLLVIDYVGGKL